MKRFVSLFLLIFSFLGLVACEAVNSNSAFINPNEEISVLLIEEDTFDVLSSNPVKINKGENAQFEVAIHNQFEFDPSSEGTYDLATQLYTIKNVTKSRNVYFKTVQTGDCLINIVNDESLGSVEITPNKKSFQNGEEVQIKVTPKGNNEFMCFTNKNPYRVLNSENPSGKAICFSNIYKFTINGNVNLVTNYFTDGLIKIKYHSNGGKTIDNEDDLTLDYSIPEQFKEPSTIFGTEFLYRDGYTLESFNTKADNSGERIGLGSSVSIKHAVDNVINLYGHWEQWEPEGNFTTKNLNDKNIQITSYSGNAEKIVIPDKIGGKYVTSIAGNAFKSLSVKKLILNEHLKTIADNAFYNLNSLESVVLFTNISSVSANGIVSTSLKTFFCNSTLYNYSIDNRYRDFSGQIQTIKANTNRVILFGLSTLRYNTPLEVLREKYPDKFFYLAGPTAGVNYRIMFDILTKVIDIDDKIFFSMLETALPPNGQATAKTFLYFKYSFDLLSLINYQDYKSILLPALAKYVQDYTENQTDNIYMNQDFTGGYEKDGMIFKDTEPVNESNVNRSYSVNFSTYQKNENIVWIKNIAQTNGISDENIILLWSSYNKNSVTNTSVFTQYQTYVTSRLPYQALDSITDNIYPGNYFCKNDSTHLSMVGGTARINRWTNLIEEKNLL